MNKEKKKLLKDEFVEEVNILIVINLKENEQVFPGTGNKYAFYSGRRNKCNLKVFRVFLLMIPVFFYEKRQLNSLKKENRIKKSSK